MALTYPAGDGLSDDTDQQSEEGLPDDIDLHSEGGPVRRQ